MSSKPSAPRDRREQLLHRVQDLAERALFGTLSETFRTCGQAGCRCHRGGPKHGPHLSVSFRGSEGKTTGYYVPWAAQEEVRAGIAAWKEIQQCLRELAEVNKQRALAGASRKSAT